MAQGRVKWFNGKKGYGFIETDSQGDVFVHYSSIEGSGFRSLREAEAVTFEIEASPKGPQAVNVRRAQGPLPPVGQGDFRRGRRRPCFFSEA